MFEVSFLFFLPLSFIFVSMHVCGVYGGPYLPPDPPPRELTPLSPNSTPLSLKHHRVLGQSGSGESGVELGESGVSSGGGGRYGPP